MTPTTYTDALARITSQQMDVMDLLSTTELIKASNTPTEQKMGMVVNLYKTWIAYNEANPILYAIYFNYGAALAEANDLVGSVNALRETIRIKPDFYNSYVNLSSVYEKLGRTDLAVGNWNSMVSTLSAVTPEAVSYKVLALKHMGRMFEDAQNDTTAESVFQQSLEIFQDQPDVMQHYISLRQRQCKWPIMINNERISKKKLIAAISPLSVACYTDDPLYHLASSYRYNRKIVGIPPRKEGAVKHTHPKKMSSGRLRIGYVSSDLRDHAVGFSLMDLFECHDRKKFEIFAYYCGIKTADTTMARIKKNVEHWTDINDLDHDTVAQKIRDDKIDILIDLNGYTKDARTQVFSRRPAPVAVNWFGFPNSMGSSYHQYIIADKHIIPEEYERYYTEKVLHLPCYQPNDRKRVVAETPTRASAGLPDDKVVLCCLNGMQKTTELMFKRWMMIMEKAPETVLWLLSGHEASHPEGSLAKPEELGI